MIFFCYYTRTPQWDFLKIYLQCGIWNPISELFILCYVKIQIHWSILHFEWIFFFLPIHDLEISEIDHLENIVIIAKHLTKKLFKYIWTLNFMAMVRSFQNLNFYLKSQISSLATIALSYLLKKHTSFIFMKMAIYQMHEYE